MASALQCPACGFKHRLSELSGDPVFSCEQCGRLLKTPAGVPPTRAVGSDCGSSPEWRHVRCSAWRSAARDQTAVGRSGPTPVAAPSFPAASTPSPTRRSGPLPPATMAAPLQILAWVVAVLVGGVIVRYLREGHRSGHGGLDHRHPHRNRLGPLHPRLRIVPFWALASAGLMTGFVEGLRWWGGRRRSMPSGRPAQPRGSPAGRNGEASEAAHARPEGEAPGAEGPHCEPHPHPHAGARTRTRTGTRSGGERVHVGRAATVSDSEARRRHLLAARAAARGQRTIGGFDHTGVPGGDLALDPAGDDEELVEPFALERGCVARVRSARRRRCRGPVAVLELDDPETGRGTAACPTSAAS